MNKEQLKKINETIRKREEAVARVLNEYLARDGCPCGIKQFVYWAGKKQGPGWQDSIQNQLVESALKLKCFVRVEDFKKEYWLEGVYYCKNCGTEWKHFSQEWRMLAFQEQLLLVGDDDPSKLFDDIIGAEIFATYGKEPSDKKSLTLKEWENFMLETAK